jgi:hypothetical protein
MSNRAGSQLFTTSWLGLGKAETPITADKRLRASHLAQIAFGNFFYPQNVIGYAKKERR